MIRIRAYLRLQTGVEFKVVDVAIQLARGVLQCKLGETSVSPALDTTQTQTPRRAPCAAGDRNATVRAQGPKRQT